MACPSHCSILSFTVEIHALTCNKRTAQTVFLIDKMCRYVFICVVQSVWSCWARACSCMTIRRTEMLSWLVSRCKIMMASHGYRRKAPHPTISWEFCSLDFRIVCVYMCGGEGWAFVLENCKWPHVACSSYMQLCVRSHWFLNTVPTRDMLTLASLNRVYFHSSPFLCISAGCARPPVSPQDAHK